MLKRPAVLVLLLTFVAVVTVTLWAPVHWVNSLTGPVPGRSWARQWIGDVHFGPLSVADQVEAFGSSRFTGMIVRRVDGVRLLVEVVLILAVGGLLALALHTRERKRASLQSPIE